MHYTTRFIAQTICLALWLPGSVVLGGCASRPAEYDTLTTRRLDLVNDTGRVIARLGVDEEGSGGLFLLDAAGQNRAALIHDDSQTALCIFDADGTIRIGVAQFTHGGGGVALHGESSQGAAVLYLKDRAGSLRFFDEHGTVLRQIPDPAPAAGMENDG